jgi:hypothetical protein
MFQSCFCRLCILQFNDRSDKTSCLPLRQSCLFLVRLFPRLSVVSFAGFLCSVKLPCGSLLCFKHIYLPIRLNLSCCLLSDSWNSGNREMLPVDEVTRKIVRNNWPALIRMIELDSGLVHILYAKGYISHRQREVIEGQQFATQKTEKLLEILLRKSLAVFAASIRCFEETKQHHVLKLLDGTAGNAMMYFHFASAFSV